MSVNWALTCAMRMPLVKIQLGATTVHAMLDSLEMVLSVVVSIDGLRLNKYSKLFLYILADVDECDTGTHDCVHNCNNVIGSFVCFCKDGYKLEEDGINCKGAIL